MGIRCIIVGHNWDICNCKHCGLTQHQWIIDHLEDCPYCEGRGHGFPNYLDCYRCAGTGSAITLRCTQCDVQRKWWGIEKEINMLFCEGHDRFVRR